MVLAQSSPHLNPETFAERGCSFLPRSLYLDRRPAPAPWRTPRGPTAQFRCNGPPATRGSLVGPKPTSELLVATKYPLQASRRSGLLPRAGFLFGLLLRRGYDAGQVELAGQLVEPGQVVVAEDVVFRLQAVQLLA